MISLFAIKQFSNAISVFTESCVFFSCPAARGFRKFSCFCFHSDHAICFLLLTFLVSISQHRATLRDFRETINQNAADENSGKRMFPRGSPAPPSKYKVSVQ